MLKKILIIILLICAGICLITDSALATKFQEGLQATGAKAFGATPTDLLAPIVNLVKNLFIFIGVIFVALLIYGGFLYMTAAGADEKVKKGKGVIKTSIIGLFIIFSGYFISYFIASQFETPGMTGLNTNHVVSDECMQNLNSAVFYSQVCCDQRYPQMGLDTGCCNLPEYRDNHGTECPAPAP
ncbi:MAG: hypothetical protein A2Y82_00895 [Candidatus Buchananbacteria bacterium RBG_13_36_9]|uniref:Uncharacterized protein n=1 Tax=Candidatus Buchananbacteria bacterium RBG_13_36_9 TaxID=1797530 RepID=A0A1G1XNF3_9BACT|nr:MAG: hypothetical protein A2Y82_00895 [Candidatus Buchananbacteria bacterium RBG_13_36_9]